MESNVEKKVVFKERWGRRSYLVDLIGLNYGNDRPPHVETHEEIAPGTEKLLGERIVSGKAVMYQVIGITNNFARGNNKSAHITVFFGDRSEHHKY